VSFQECFGEPLERVPGKLGSVMAEYPSGIYVLRMGKIWDLGGSESKPKQRNLNIHIKVTFRAAA